MYKCTTQEGYAWRTRGFTRVAVPIWHFVANHKTQLGGKEPLIWTSQRTTKHPIHGTSRKTPDCSLTLMCPRTRVKSTGLSLPSMSAGSSPSPPYTNCTMLPAELRTVMSYCEHRSSSVCNTDQFSSVFFPQNREIRGNEIVLKQMQSPVGKRLVVSLLQLSHLHESPLHVPSLCSLHGSVHQPLSASHRVEEEFRRCQARVETVRYESLGRWYFG